MDQYRKSPIRRSQVEALSEAMKELEMSLQHQAVLLSLHYPPLQPNIPSTTRLMAIPQNGKS